MRKQIVREKELLDIDMASTHVRPKNFCGEPHMRHFSSLFLFAPAPGLEPGTTRLTGEVHVRNHAGGRSTAFLNVYTGFRNLGTPAALGLPEEMHYRQSISRSRTQTAVMPRSDLVTIP